MTNWTGDVTIGLGWVYYDGPVDHTQFHQHYAVQICFPTTTSLHIETRTQKLNTERFLVIGSNISHRIYSPSRSAKILYVDPLLLATRHRMSAGGVDILDLSSSYARSLEQALATGAASVSDDFDPTRLIWPDRLDLKSTYSIDPRIKRSIEHILASDDLSITLAHMAREAGLSMGRFRHLFSNQIGMPLKSYLLWTKLQRAIQSLSSDSSLTRAAHVAGFSDSPHLSRTFKRTFGLSPNDLIKSANVIAKKTEQ